MTKRMATYEVLICPVCLRQVERDWETGGDCWHEEYGGNVEAVEVVARVKEVDRSEAVKAVVGKLAAQKDEATQRRKEREEWEALPAEERERIKAERWAALTSTEKAIKEMTDGMIEDMHRSFSRQAIGRPVEK